MRESMGSSPPGHTHSRLLGNGGSSGLNGSMVRPAVLSGQASSGIDSDSDEEWEPGDYGLVDVPQKHRYTRKTASQRQTSRYPDGYRHGGGSGSGSGNGWAQQQQQQQLHQHHQQQQLAPAGPQEGPSQMPASGQSDARGGGQPVPPPPHAASGNGNGNGNGNGQRSPAAPHLPLTPTPDRPNHRTSSGGSFAFEPGPDPQPRAGTPPILLLPHGQPIPHRQRSAKLTAQAAAEALELAQRQDSAAFGSEFAAPL